MPSGPSVIGCVGSCYFTASTSDSHLRSTLYINYACRFPLVNAIITTSTSKQYDRKDPLNRHVSYSSRPHAVVLFLFVGGDMSVGERQPQARNNTFSRR